ELHPRAARDAAEEPDRRRLRVRARHAARDLRGAGVVLPRRDRVGRHHRREHLARHRPLRAHAAAGAEGAARARSDPADAGADRALMTFEAPLLLLTLLALPVAVLVLALVQRRRKRYAVQYTNLDVLAGVAGRGSAWRRYLAAALFLTAVAALCVGVAR